MKVQTIPCGLLRIGACALAGWALLFSSAYAAAPSQELAGESPEEADRLLKPMTEMVEFFKRFNLPLEPQRASKAMIEALTRTADPGSRVMTEAEILQMHEQQMGLVYEAPLQFSSTNGLPAITGSAPESAAAKAGLQVGDLIEKIDDHELLSNTAPAEVTRLLRSLEPDPARLMVRRVNEKSREAQLPREERRLPAIDKTEELPVGFCYVKLNGVYEGSGRAVVSLLRGWSESGRFGVVIDLRGAGGADLESVGDIAGLFAESGAVLFSLRDRRDQDLQVVKSAGGSHLGMPTMVLVDRYTTGAAEVLTAALAASVRGAMVLGEPTAGDPMVREIVPLPTGEKLYVTTRKLVMANGKGYNGWEGVVPAVEISEEENALADYEPSTPLMGAKELSEEEKEDRQLRERVRGDAALRRAVDVLLGLKALNIRGFGIPEKPAN
ncbi:MAG TPA: hypothetical protein DCZ95_15395 [Verrucomicrobia bacterium]|nr:MAG: hypothetical protein A2X46_19150 [Lentisphaerae bacterium GWF2_57_35]HBA85470.1 hypothetical protein [Verrucomicrobiota bacterium]